MNVWALHWRMTRPAFLTITVVGCLIGFASAWACGCGFDPLRAVVTVVLAVLAHAGANVLNDACDARNGADAANTQGLFPFTGGSRFIQQGVVTEQQTRQWAWVLLGLTALGGVWLAVRSGPALLWVGMAGLALAWAYSAPPLQLMSRGLGELTVALAWWLVVVGADVAQRGQWFIIPAYAGVSYALLIANILLINGVPDAVADAQVGKRTLATRLSPTQLATLYLALCLAAHAWLAVGVWQLIPPIPTLMACIALLPGLAAAALLFRHHHHPDRLRPAVGLTIVTAHLHGLGLALGLVWGRWMG